MSSATYGQEQTMTIDDAEWHDDTVAELDLDVSAAAIHIGIFLVWAGDRGLLAPAHQATVTAARQRISTPSQHAHTYFVAQFGAWDLTETGRQFAEHGYGAYLDRIVEVPELARFDVAYEVPDTWETYDSVVPLLDELFAAWREARGGPR